MPATAPAIQSPPSSSQPAIKRTRWFLNPHLPFASLASGMFALTSVPHRPFTRGILIDVAGFKGVDTLPGGYEVTLADVEGDLAIGGDGLEVGRDELHRRQSRAGELLAVHQEAVAIEDAEVVGARAGAADSSGPKSSTT